MTEQKRRVRESVSYLKTESPFKGKVNTAVFTYHNPSFMKEFKIIKKIKYSDIPPSFNNPAENHGELIYAKSKKDKQKVIILNGHINFYNGFSMKDAAHPVYVLRELGVKSLILIDEVGHLNPRFKAGGISLIYDHINLMGDNPLIGENDNTFGARFPDMSDPYKSKLYSNTEELLLDKKLKFHPSVYIGVAGPETETEAECVFYRETGADVLGYSLIPENIALVHCGMECIAFGMITRELVAGRLKEISTEEKLKNRLKAEKAFAPVIADLVSCV
jgi:purine-nucleoside phosphorylase